MVEFSPFAHTIMERTYAHNREDRKETWEEIAYRVTKNVMRAVGVDMRQQLAKEICRAITERKFMPGGRYLYAAGRQYHMVNNCLALRVHDSREGWAELLSKASMALMSGAGIGVDYSEIRHEGAAIRKTGGVATGPLSLMQILNECGRGIMQGGNRRCLTGDTVITLANGGFCELKNIQIGDEVGTRLGPRKILAKSKERQLVYRITTEHGQVTCSANHRWLGALNDRIPRWLSTSQLRDDCNHKMYVHLTSIPGGVRRDLGWAYTLGYFIGNGCAYSSRRTHEITFNLPTKWYVPGQGELIKSTMRKYYGVNPVERSGHGACREIRCRSKKHVTTFQKWKIPHQCPRIPNEILQGDIETRSAFLAGWFDSDGSYTADSWRLSCKHVNALKAAQQLLRTLGLTTTLIMSGAVPELRICSHQRPLFITTIGKYTFKKPGNFKIHGHKSIPVKILKIEKLGKRDTYDIQVDGVAEFLANDHVSHNSAIWAGLKWCHPDAHKFIRIKNWPDEIHKLKAQDASFPATLDCTNISIQLDDQFFEAYHDDEHGKHALAHSIYWATIEQMLKTGEPGFTVDTGRNLTETLRNACAEISSRDSDDCCNLGSINLARVESLNEFKQLISLAAAFLLAGTIYSDVPYSDVDRIRSKNRRLGIGLMGIHEWLISRGKSYAPDEELGMWLAAYAKSGRAANKWADEWGLSRPKKTRAIAPNGTTGIIAETTGGAEPIFCVAYKRLYLKGDQRCYQYVIDPAAKRLIDKGVDPNQIEDAYMLARNVEKRVAFQAWLQGYVDHCISSTINLPEYGSELNNNDTVRPFGSMLLRYLPQLRGITCYPDGSRSGQPLTPVSYEEAVAQEGIEIVEEAMNVCELKGGSCGD